MRGFDKTAGYTRKEHALENVMIKGAIPYSEARVLNAIVRLTEGFKHYRAVNLSYSDLAETTGMNSGAVKRAVKELLAKRFVFRTKRGKSKASKTRYRVNYDSNDWKIDPLEPVPIRTENYEGCEVGTEDENDPRFGNSGGNSDPSTGDHFDPTTGYTDDPSTGGDFDPSFGEQTQTSTSTASEDRKYDRKKRERSERKRHTACVLEEREQDHTFLNCKESIEARTELSRNEAIWQAAMFVKRFWRKRITQDHWAALEEGFPTDDESVENRKFALELVHEEANEVFRMCEEMRATGRSPVKDPVGRSIDDAISKLSIAYHRTRVKNPESYPI